MKQDKPNLDGQAAQGFGAVLGAAREAQGLSVGDMVGRVRISVRQVRALESENMADLPEPVYVRGFIRSYAKALGLDPKPLVDDFNNRFGDSFAIGVHQIPQVAYSSEQVLSNQGPSPWWRVAGILILAGAIIAGVWAVTSQGMLKDLFDGDPVLEKPAAAVADKTEKVEKKAAAPAKEAAPASGATAAAPVPAPAPVPVKAPPVSKAKTEIPGILLRPDDNAAAAQSDRKEVHIRLTPRHNSWVRVSRLDDDSTVFEQEIPAGSVRSIRGNKPLRVLIGNSEGITVEINDVELDYKRFSSPSDKTVRFRMY